MSKSTDNSFSIYSGPAARQVHELAWQSVSSLLVGDTLAISDDHDSFQVEDASICVWKASCEPAPTKDFQSVILHTLSQDNIARVAEYLRSFPPTYVIVLAHNDHSPDHFFTAAARLLGRGKLSHLFYSIKKIETPLYAIGFEPNDFRSSVFIPLSLMGILPASLQSRFDKLLSDLDRRWSKINMVFWGRNLVRRYARYVTKEERYWVIDHNTKISNVFDKEYAPTTGKGFIYAREVIKLLNLTDAQPGDRALDLGCGTGTYALELARQGVKSFASDLVIPMLRITHHKGQQFGFEIPVTCMDGQFMPLANESLDIIISVITNDVPNIDLLFSEASRVLKPGGKLILLNYTNMTSIGGLKTVLKALLRYKGFKYYYIRFDSQLNNCAKQYRLRLTAKMGIGLFLGSGLPWELQKMIIQKMDAFEKKLSRSRFEFVYPQTFLLYRKAEHGDNKG